MSDSRNASGGGIGVIGLLGIVFIVLKLTGYIQWSWIWVLAPLWGSAALVVLLLGVALLASLFLHLRQERRNKS